jgi:hypothetical protein
MADPPTPNRVGETSNTINVKLSAVQSAGFVRSIPLSAAPREQWLSEHPRGYIE